MKVATRQLSTSIFGRSSIIDETATAFVPSMPFSRRTATYDKLATAISNLFFRFTLDYSTCWLSLSLSLCTPTTPPPRALVNRGALSTLLVSLHQALPRRPLQGCAHLRPQPSTYFQHLRAFRHSRSLLRLFMSPVAKVCCSINRAPSSTCEWSLGACVCEWLKMLGLVCSVW